MKLLLDTNVWLWMTVDPERLSSHARRHISRESNERLLSAAVSWEISIKYSIGKLPLHEAPSIFIPKLMRTTKTLSLPVQHIHTTKVADLPLYHKDPFDRLLIAQALIEDIPIVTSDDKVFARYGVNVIKAT